MNKIRKIKTNFLDIPLNEYPRSLLKRNSYLSLNGPWDFCILKSNKEKPEFDQKVIVPYSIETPLSNINHLCDANEIMCYNKEVVLPSELCNKRLILHFEGVDQICDVYINNQKVGSHIGGYTNFEFDISQFVKSYKFNLSVVVVDKTDLSYLPTGKQRLKPGGIWYTSTSGIYKSVWIEAVGKEIINNVRFTPLLDEKAVSVFVSTDKNSVCKVNIDNQEFIVNTNKETVLKLNIVHPWCIEDPYLYKVKIVYGDDVVDSYFGLRKIEIKNDSNNIPRIYLNNKIIFLKGLLDQGYYFLGGLTPKDNQTYYDEIKKLKDLGFNCLRKHIKTESDLFYYYCDLLGMLVIQDFPCGGGKFSKKVASIPCVKESYKPKDNVRYKLYGREDKKGRDFFIKDNLKLQRDLYNHPSIIAYTIFNEAWNQFDSMENYTRFKESDPTRLYDTTSGWVDFGYSDFYSIHNYFFKHTLRKDPYKKNRPYLISEYGGYALMMEDHYFGRKKSYGYRSYKDLNEISKAYEALNIGQILPLIKGGLVGCIYTQVSDVEDEINGLFTFDRMKMKIRKESIIKVNKEFDKEVKMLESKNENN